MKKAKRVVVTGGAGQIAYALLFKIANGDLLGPDQPIALHILEIPEMIQALEGVQMELEDCAYPLLHEVVIGSDPFKLFKDVEIALLVGAKPRGPGMERKDLLQDNGKIFIQQGRALNEAAHRDVKVLVVGNPCNTNCWIAMHNAPDLNKKNFHAMMRLDQNRATAQLAKKGGVHLSQVKKTVIWGNHSATQVPDYFNAHIQGKHAHEHIQDQAWFEDTFIPMIQKRGAVVIEKRGKSSAASAAQAAVDSIKDILIPTPEGEHYSSAVCSDGNPYGIEEDLIFSFPCRTKTGGNWEFVSGISINNSLKEKLKRTEKELIEERDLVKDLVKVGAR